MHLDIDQPDKEGWGTSPIAASSVPCLFDVSELQDIERERKKRNNPEAMEEDEVDDVSEIKAAHFEESMKYARRSVSDADIRKYQLFAQTLQQSRGFGSEFRFPDRPSTSGPAAGAASDPFASTNPGGDDDDLYS